MNRIEQDAADELAAHEQQRAWRERATADWQRAKQPMPVGRIIFPEISAADERQRANDIKAGLLPF